MKTAFINKRIKTLTIYFSKLLNENKSEKLFEYLKKYF